MEELLEGFIGLTWGKLAMFAIGLALIWAAIKKQYEPMLLLPIGFGAILANIPGSSAVGEHGVLTYLMKNGIENELFPVLIFVAVGAMIDFGPLLSRPFMLCYGFAAQIGIVITMVAARMLGFDLGAATAIGNIGAADGPMAIVVSARLAPQLLGPISVAAYSYMALVPLIQPPVIRLMTTKAERTMRMPYRGTEISRRTRILFPIIVTIIASLVAPICTALVGMLMFGNLIRECGVLERLSKSAQNELANLVTLLLGITIGSTMVADRFLTRDTLFIMLMGLIAFVFDTAGGVLFAKVANIFLKDKVNPMVGAAGISAFPMSARVVQKIAQEEDPGNVILPHTIAANVAGQIGSVFVGGLLLAIATWMIANNIDLPVPVLF
ncbi:sodium ion-translocating decarboxylase subunit beta [Oligosphaera ethanolica]|uniref:Oxaloacetate decarboxylase beta subunit n=1 Tax=Oligosphaera ethanolica TaxID=760260 RepID=A0AAE3VHV8_9BACT|nr:sodium ion-translocating decarboxylase subunit beta [Oligosphaera ethanolica]MDQ0290685.1 oxaloacetate decarboxylase beta subunit [Oligosphaera ethanolica]